jgi:hypothetical protein
MGEGFGGSLSLLATASNRGACKITEYFLSLLSIDFLTSCLCGWNLSPVQTDWSSRSWQWLWYATKLALGD